MLDDIEGPALHQTMERVRFDDLDRVAQDVMAYKDALPLAVEESTTLTEIAERTGMPLPSLSRFLSQPSMPRRAMLPKIADALEPDAVEVETKSAV